MRKSDETRLALAICLYQRSAKVCDIEAETGISSDVLYRGLRAAGIDLRRPQRRSSLAGEALEQALAAYRNGENATAIARRLGVTSQMVCGAIKRAGIEPRTNELPVSAAFVAAVRTRYAVVGRAALAREFGVSTWQVTKIAKRLGLVRSYTKTIGHDGMGGDPPVPVVEVMLEPGPSAPVVPVMEGPRLSHEERRAGIRRALGRAAGLDADRRLAEIALARLYAYCPSMPGTVLVSEADVPAMVLPAAPVSGCGCGLAGLA